MQVRTGKVRGVVNLENQKSRVGVYISCLATTLPPIKGSHLIKRKETQPNVRVRIGLAGVGFP